ncbi:signal recognition particle, SRP19 subunit [Obba rivulosa]|uniref:Signal recognition particle, SRP19 subunit n=1 Tax=Obba rivulosa TaxID=1052685 RepID=A0A8E2AMB0_9APHY|nr:signal recognition particle, SRP19 subunit [Obba rivulosa]
MSRRAAVVEEFDDDTELPLPSQPLPNTGARGAILQELSDDDDSDAPPLRAPTAGPASPSLFPPSRASNGRPEKMVTDLTPYKKWTCVYPIYIDAKRPYGRGERRVPRQRSVWWPLSKDLADAASRLGLGTLHEVNKAHPRDWENPGRVRVQWKKDGKPMHPAIRTKKQLLEMLALQIQLVKPDLTPKPPYASEPSDTTTAAVSATPPVRPSTPQSSAKGKASAAKGKAPSTPAAISTAPAPRKNQSQAQRPKPPVPPAPWPALASRVSSYSPALPSGVLVETIKAGMSAQEAAPGTGGGGKGKRKVVRVRA